DLKPDDVRVCTSFDIGHVCTRGPTWEYDNQDGGDKCIGWTQRPTKLVLANWLDLMIFGGKGMGPKCPATGYHYGGWWINRSIVAHWPCGEEECFYKAGDDNHYDLNVVRNMHVLTPIERVFELTEMLYDINGIFENNIRIKNEVLGMPSNPSHADQLQAMTKTWIAQAVNDIIQVEASYRAQLIIDIHGRGRQLEPRSSNEKGSEKDFWGIN
ncbi:unnamed protein product, partial [Prorocentrum cordatum]